MMPTDTPSVAAVTCYLQVCQVSSSPTSSYPRGESYTAVNMMYEGLSRPLLSSYPSSSSYTSPDTLLPASLALCTLDGFIISYLSTEQLSQHPLAEGQVIKYSIDMAITHNIYPDPSALIQRYSELSGSDDLLSHTSDEPTDSSVSPPQPTVLSTPTLLPLLLLPGQLVIEQSKVKGQNYDHCKSDRKLPDPMSKVLFHLLHFFNESTTTATTTAISPDGDEGMDREREGHIVRFEDILNSL